MHKARSPNHLACRKRFHASVIRALERRTKKIAAGSRVTRKFHSCSIGHPLEDVRLSFSIKSWPEHFRVYTLILVWNYFYNKWMNRGISFKFIFLQGKYRDIIFLYHKRVQVKGFSWMTIYDSTRDHPHWVVEFKCFF